MTTEYDILIQEATEQYLPDGYDWRMFKAQLWQESKLDPNAESPVGAVGIGQFMPGTWREWSKKTGFEGFERTHPKASIYTAANYMNYLIEEWSWPRPLADRYCLAMASYNAGLGNILQAQKRMNNPSLYFEIIRGLEEVTGHNSFETIGYVSNILSYCDDLILTGEV